MNAIDYYHKIRPRGYGSLFLSSHQGFQIFVSNFSNPGAWATCSPLYCTICGSLLTWTSHDFPLGILESLHCLQVYEEMRTVKTGHVNSCWRSRTFLLWNLHNSSSPSPWFKNYNKKEFVSLPWLLSYLGHDKPYQLLFWGLFSPQNSKIQVIISSMIHFDPFVESIGFYLHDWPLCPLYSVSFFKLMISFSQYSGYGWFDYLQCQVCSLLLSNKIFISVIVIFIMDHALLTQACFCSIETMSSFISLGIKGR